MDATARYALADCARRTARSGIAPAGRKTYLFAPRLAKLMDATETCGTVDCVAFITVGGNVTEIQPIL